MKQIPIGQEDFKEIIDRNYYYIDKTMMIKDIIDMGTKVNLFTRPRRFGKSLNISMIQRFFEHADEDYSYLFDGLEISNAGDKYMSHQGQYPVISLSLKSMKQDSYDDAYGLYKIIIAEEYKRHKALLHYGEFSEKERQTYLDICDMTADRPTYLYSIKLLCDYLYFAYKKDVIILIDEYDVPLESAYFHGYYDKMVSLIRSVFESALKTNPHLKFGILTGCLRISKESIFTGLNNLAIYSVRSNKYSQYFGFTEAEVKSLLAEYNLTDLYPEVKKWYDGYQFGDTEIYNPWSVLNFANDKIIENINTPETYWADTSSNAIVHEMIAKGDSLTHELLSELMLGKSITKPVYDDITYNNLNIREERVWSVLLHTGYLKSLKYFLGADNLLYAKLAIPNTELEVMYRGTIKAWLDEKISETSRTDLFDSVINENTKEFENILCDWLEETISYYDGKELYYHGFLTGLLGGFKGYTVKSNRESGNGRPDILLLRNRRTVAVIIEIKIAGSISSLESECDIALQQIEDRNYESGLKADGYEKVIKYGVAFCDKVCKVKKG